LFGRKRNEESYEVWNRTNDLGVHFKDVPNSNLYPVAGGISFRYVSILFVTALLELRVMARYLPALYSILPVGGNHITLTVSSANISFETNLQN